MQKKILHLTQVVLELNQVIERIRTKKAESGANFTNVFRSYEIWWSKLNFLLIKKIADPMKMAKKTYQRR